MRARLRLAVANANVLRLALGWCGWITAESAYAVVVLVIAYQAGGTPAVAVVGALRALPRAILAPLGSALADRYPRANVIVAVQAARAGLVLLMAGAVALRLSVALVYVVVLVIGAVSSPFRPAVYSLIAQLVDRPDELTAANSLYSFVEAAASLVGPVLAAVLLQVTSAQIVFVLVSATLAVAAALTSGIRTEFRAPAHDGSATGWRDTLDPLRGFALLSRTPGVRLVFALFSAQMLMQGLLTVFVVVAAVTLLGLGEPGVGSLLAAVGAGGIAGAVVAMAVIKRRGLAPAFAAGLSLWGIPLIVIGVWANRPVAFVALAAVGLGNAVESVSGFTLFQRVVPDHLLGRAFGALWSSVTLTMAVGSLLAAPMISAFGLRTAMIASGSALLLLLALSWPGLRHVDRHVRVPERELALLRGLPLFQSLPLVSLERLARSLRREHVRCGDDVVTQGDPGDRYYVIDRGSFTVLVDGREVASLGAGAGFGEIALLHQERRSATVRAASDGEVYSLDGRTFVLAVTGHVPTDRTALDIARGHLDADRARASQEG